MCDMHKKRDSVVVLSLFLCHNLSLLTSACWEIAAHVILDKSGRGYTGPVIQMSQKCSIPVLSMNVPVDQHLLNTNYEFHLRIHHMITKLQFIANQQFSSCIYWYTLGNNFFRERIIVLSPKLGLRISETLHESVQV